MSYGSTKDELLLDEPVSMDFLNYLENFGEVTVRSDLKTPVYFFYSEDYISMKGLLNDDYVEMRRSLRHIGETEDFFGLVLSSYGGAGEGVSRVKAEMERIASVNA